MGDAGGFHARLRECVARSGLLVKELSAKSGVAKRTIDNWLALSDPTVPRVDDLVAVARVLNVSAELLVFGGAPLPEPPIPFRLRDLVDDLALLSPERLEDVARLVRPWADEARRALKREAAAG